MRAGDWLCSACNSHNFASRSACFRCQAPKGGYAPPEPRGALVAPTGMQDGDWICPACSNHNFKSRQQCNRCQTPRPVSAGFAAQAQMTLPSPRPSSAPSLPPHAGPLIAPTGMREGDWICPQCSNHNFATRGQCNRCQAPKPVEMSMAALPVTAAAMAASPYATPPMAPGGMREGDWLCPSCGNHNFSQRMVCNKCQAPRPL